jgi:hypothetical protein
MIEKKKIELKSNIVDRKAKELSEEMSKHEYTISVEKVNPPLKKMWKIVRMMGFSNDQTNTIIESVKRDLVGKEMKKGDSFHELIKESFTKAISGVVEEIQENKK